MNDLADYYMNDDIIVQDRTLGSLRDRNIKARWEDMMVEAVDANDEYTLCTAKVITREEILTTKKTSKYEDDRFYLIKDGLFYRIVQSRKLSNINCIEELRELLVAPTDNPSA